MVIVMVKAGFRRTQRWRKQSADLFRGSAPTRVREPRAGVRARVEAACQLLTHIFVLYTDQLCSLSIVQNYFFYIQFSTAAELVPNSFF